MSGGQSVAPAGTGRIASDHAAVLGDGLGAGGAEGVADGRASVGEGAGAEDGEAIAAQLARTIAATSDEARRARGVAFIEKGSLHIVSAETSVRGLCCGRIEPVQPGLSQTSGTYESGAPNAPTTMAPGPPGVSA